MAVACSIFTLDGGFQLFWAAFDLLMTVVSLKVAIGFKKKMILGIYSLGSKGGISPSNFFSRGYENLFVSVELSQDRME